MSAAQHDLAVDAELDANQREFDDRGGFNPDRDRREFEALWMNAEMEQREIAGWALEELESAAVELGKEKARDCG